MKISVIPSSPDHLGNKLFVDKTVRDNVFVSYRFIKMEVEKRGWQIATFDQLSFEEADMVLAFNFAAFPEAVLEALSHPGAVKMTAIVREPPEIIPLYYDNDIQQCFGQFFLPENTTPNNKNLFFLDFPVSPIHVNWLPFNEKKLLVSITSGKFKNFKGALYAERVRAIKHFQSAIPEQFDMYGQGWILKRNLFSCFSPHRLFPCYKGTVFSKHETMRHYKFSLCYENSNNVYGYVSEKIFDSMLSGCVPIYLGAPDIEKYVPEACFIDRRKFVSDLEVELFIRGMSKEEYENYLIEIKKYLNSDSYLDRLPERYAKKILFFLDQKVKSESENYNIEGYRKLTILAAMKRLRFGKIADKYKGAMLFIKHARYDDWKKLSKVIVGLVFLKAGFTDIYTWIQMKKI